MPGFTGLLLLTPSGILRYADGMDNGRSQHFLRFCGTVIVAVAFGCAVGVQSSTADDLPGHVANQVQPGPCVLLKNGNVIWGTASQVGHQVIIKSGGREISLRYDDVACWGNSIEDLFRFRVDHRQGDSNVARMNDAKWCLRYGLVGQAMSALQEVHPQFKHSRQFQLLANRVVRQHLALTKPQQDAAPGQTAAVRTVAFDQPIESRSTVQGDPVDDRAVDVSPELLAEFTRDVQPVLLNRCAGCHRQGVSTTLQLTRPTGSRRASATLTQMNLRAILPFATPSMDGQSALYKYATEAHGTTMTTAPLTKRDQVAVENIRRWLTALAGQSESKSPDDNLPVPSVQVEPGLTLMDKVDASAMPPSERTKLAERPTGIGAAGNGPTGGGPVGEGPARLPEIEDPFDPERFNRQRLR